MVTKEKRNLSICVNEKKKAGPNDVRTWAENSENTRRRQFWVLACATNGHTQEFRKQAQWWAGFAAFCGYQWHHRATDG